MHDRSNKNREREGGSESERGYKVIRNRFVREISGLYIQQNAHRTRRKRKK